MKINMVPKLSPQSDLYTLNWKVRLRHGQRPKCHKLRLCTLDEKGELQPTRALILCLILPVLPLWSSSCLDRENFHCREVRLAGTLVRRCSLHNLFLDSCRSCSWMSLSKPHVSSTSTLMIRKPPESELNPNRYHARWLRTDKHLQRWHVSSTCLSCRV